MLSHSACVLRSSGVTPLLAVTGADHSLYSSELEPLGFTLKHNPDHSQGMGASLRVGLSCLQGSHAVLVYLADMPQLQASTLSALIDCWHGSNKRQFIVPVVDGQQGNPVIIPACLFSKFIRADNDVGARTYMKKHPNSVLGCAVSDLSIYLDFDTEADLLSAGWLPPHGSSELSRL